MKIVVWVVCLRSIVPARQHSQLGDLSAKPTKPFQAPAIKSATGHPSFLWPLAGTGPHQLDERFQRCDESPIPGGLPVFREDERPEQLTLQANHRIKPHQPNDPTKGDSRPGSWDVTQIARRKRCRIRCHGGVNDFLYQPGDRVTPRGYGIRLPAILKLPDCFQDSWIATVPNRDGWLIFHVNHYDQRMRRRQSHPNPLRSSSAVAD